MLSQKRRRDITLLGRRKGRLQQRAYLIEGIRLVESAVHSGVVLREILVTYEAADHPRVMPLLGMSAVPVTHVDARWMRSVSDLETGQGLLAVAELPDERRELPSDFRRALLLDGIQDPGNVGTLIRTAAWFGVDVLVAGPGTADLFSPKVVRATMGGLWDLTPVQTDDLAVLLGGCRDQGYVVYGGALDGEPVHTWEPATPSVFVLGSEAHGISEQVSSYVDRRIFIPRAGSRAKSGMAGVESLNVAAAGAVLLHRWTG